MIVVILVVVVIVNLVVVVVVVANCHSKWEIDFYSLCSTRLYYNFALPSLSG